MPKIDNSYNNISKIKSFLIKDLRSSILQMIPKTYIIYFVLKYKKK